MGWNVKIDPGVVTEDIPFEFLFVFVLKVIVNEYKVSLADITIHSIIFSSNSRKLDNGDYYDQNNRKSAWIVSDIENLVPQKNMTDSEVFSFSTQRYHKAKNLTHDRINMIQLTGNESVFEVFQDIILKYSIAGESGNKQEWVSVPVGYCIAKPSRFGL